MELLCFSIGRKDLWIFSTESRRLLAPCTSVGFALVPSPEIASYVFGYIGNWMRGWLDLRKAILTNRECFSDESMIGKNPYCLETMDGTTQW